VRTPWARHDGARVGRVVSAVVVGAVAAVLGAGCGGDGGAGPDLADVAATGETDQTDERGSEPADDGGTTIAGVTTTTSLEFDWESYEPGECLDWALDGPRQSTDRVDCTDPHRMEVIGSVALDDLAERPADWGPVVDERCTPLVEPYLGRVLAPDDRLVLHWIHPLEDAWDDGIRELWCGLAARDDTTDAGVLREPARVLEPALHRPQGTCVALVDAAVPDAGTEPVDCGQPHQFQVVGTIAIPDRPAFPDDTAWDEITDGCAEVGTAATGLAMGFDPGEHAAYVQLISEHAWAAGARSTDCWVALLGPDGGPEATTDTVVAPPS
jgi:hypothetical protein